jgi:aminoglycoside phosphotransferase (APT) family kinase protein
MPDLAAVRTFLRTGCDASIALDSLEATYIQAGAHGPTRVLYEAPAKNGDVLRLAARRVGAAKGRRIEATINARSPRPHPSTGFLQSALYVPALELLFQVFPADESLCSLPIAVDGAAMAATLGAMLAGHDRRPHLQQVVVHVVRYKPERKCLLRYELTSAGTDPTQPPAVVWARVARRSKFERTRNNLSRLHAAATGIGFDLPQPLGVVPEMAMELFGHVPGVALFASVQRADFSGLCRRVGEALGRFHKLPVEVEEVFDGDAQAKRLTENAVEFAWMLPAEAKRIATIEREIVRRLQMGTSSPLRVIHRDFHGDNILVAEDGRLALLDFEDCAMGEPADDVGSNWAQLTWHVHKAGARSAVTAAARRAFVDGYLETSETRTSSQLPTYAAMHCFLYAHQCLRHPRDVARHEDAQAMLTACEQVLERGLR